MAREPTIPPEPVYEPSALPPLWLTLVGAFGLIAAIGASAATCLDRQARAAVPLRAEVLTPSPSASVPPSRPCSAPARPEKPAICFRRFHSAGELCAYACSPLATGDGWLVLQLCRPEPAPLSDPEPDAKVLP